MACELIHHLDCLPFFCGGSKKLQFYFLSSELVVMEVEVNGEHSARRCVHIEVLGELPEPQPTFMIQVSLVSPEGTCQNYGSPEVWGMTQGNAFYISTRDGSD